MSAANRLCIYFGVEAPEAGWAAALDKTDVVLEPYHPLVQEARFAEAFPRSRRYVYVNPTTVDPWLLERLPSSPPLLGRDERWGLPRLDLDEPAAFDFAVDQAVRTLSGQRDQLHGLFVDDLDRLLPDREELAVDYLVQVTTRLGWEPGWFLNRGFALWPRIEGLDAVLLEDITPRIAAHEPARQVQWMRAVVLGSIRAAKARGVRVHSLAYRDQESVLVGSAGDEALFDELGALVDSVTSGADRALKEWRISE